MNMLFKGTRWSFQEEKGFILRDIENENSFALDLNHQPMVYDSSSLPLSKQTPFHVVMYYSAVRILTEIM